MEQHGDKTSSALPGDDFLKAAQDAYSAKAKAGANVAYSKTVAEAFGYTAEQLQSIPAESNMGLSCGNPVAAAHIGEGETVLDLGSGGGIDVFLTAAKVGQLGQVIGLDMSADMISLARRNAKKQNLRPPQVSFVQAALTEALPIASDSVDCILSNCVINLLPLSGKATLLKEVHRVLKPGGRLVLDDIIAKQTFPADIRDDLSSYVSCVSGAIQLDEYKKLLTEAGFPDALFVDTLGDLNIYYENKTDSPPASQGTCCSATPEPSKWHQPDFNANNWVASYQIYGIKSAVEAPETRPALLRWWDAYPSVISAPTLISSDKVADFLRDPTKTDSDYAVIDVRRNDHAGGHIRGSYQWPAQTFYDDLPGFFEKFGNTEQVIFYCSSSAGRGPRCAGWYQDYLNEMGKTTSTAYVLQGGVKEWLAKFQKKEDLVDQD